MDERIKACCFTGHRPEKLTKTENDICNSLEKEIRLAIADGFTKFLSGMARGTDIYAAEIVLKIRAEDPSVKLICASPFEGFEQSWKQSWQARYHTIISAADQVQYISPSYNRACFQVRNKWLILNSARVIAVYNGTPGGTKNTIDLANRHGVPVHIIEA